MYPYLIALLCLMNFAVLTFRDGNTLLTSTVLHKTELQQEEVYGMQRSLKAGLLFEEFAAQDKGGPEHSEDSPVREGLKVVGDPAKRRTVRSLNIDLVRPPNNSRFNLYAFLNEDPELRTGESSWYSMIARFLRNHYFSKGRFASGHPDMERIILNELLNQKEKIIENAESLGVDVLGTLSFADREIAQAMYLLLTGFDDVPSILNYLSYEVKKPGFCKLNFIFIDPDVLEAVVNHDEAYLQLVSLRSKCLDEIMQREEEYRQSKSVKEKPDLKSRTHFKTELTEGVSIILSRYGLTALLNKRIFDFSLGKSGDYIFLVHAETGWVTRYRYTNKRS